MKRVYEKPYVYCEQFSVTRAIADNCGEKTVNMKCLAGSTTVTDTTRMMLTTGTCTYRAQQTTDKCTYASYGNRSATSDGGFIYICLADSNRGGNTTNIIGYWNGQWSESVVDTETGKSSLSHTGTHASSDFKATVTGKISSDSKREHCQVGALVGTPTVAS